MSKEEYSRQTLPEIAEAYGKERLETILNYLESKNLEGTRPYAHFKNVLECLGHKPS